MTTAEDDADFLSLFSPIATSPLSPPVVRASPLVKEDLFADLPDDDDDVVVPPPRTVVPVPQRAAPLGLSRSGDKPASRVASSPVKLSSSSDADRRRGSSADDDRARAADTDDDDEDPLALLLGQSPRLGKTPSTTDEVWGIFQAQTGRLRSFEQKVSHLQSSLSTLVAQEGLLPASTTTVTSTTTTTTTTTTSTDEASPRRLPPLSSALSNNQATLLSTSGPPSPLVVRSREFSGKQSIQQLIQAVKTTSVDEHPLAPAKKTGRKKAKSKRPSDDDDDSEAIKHGDASTQTRPTKTADSDEWSGPDGAPVERVLSPHRRAISEVGGARRLRRTRTESKANLMSLLHGEDRDGLFNSAPEPAAAPPVASSLAKSSAAADQRSKAKSNFPRSLSLGRPLSGISFNGPGLFDDDDDDIDNDADSAAAFSTPAPASAASPATDADEAAGLASASSASAPSVLTKPSGGSSIWLFSDPFKLFPERSASPEPTAPAASGGDGDPNELNRLLETIPGLSKVLSDYRTYVAKVSVRQLSVEHLSPVFSTEKSFLTSFGDLYMGSRPDAKPPDALLSPRATETPAAAATAADEHEPRRSFVDSLISRSRLRSTPATSSSSSSSSSSLPVATPAPAPPLATTITTTGDHPQKWLLVFNDLLVVASLDLGVEHQIPLRTCWIESLEQGDYSRTGLVVRTPELVLNLYTSLATKKSFCMTLLLRLIRQELESQDSYLGPDRRIIANYVFRSGHMYTGEWLSGVPHGTGTMLSLDGTKYDGQWVNGKKHGHGFMLARSSQNYEGEWKDDLRDGWGKLTLPDENDYSLISYTGQWKRNLRHGQGTLVFTSLDSLQCEFVDDRPTNPVYWTGSSKIRYVGAWNFERRQRHGFGVGVYPSGERYYGIWKNDMREQIGVLISPTGTQYFGGWKKDRHFGKCRIRFPNGDILTATACQGEWSESLDIEKASFQIAEIQRQYSRNRQPPPRIASANQLGEKWLALFRAKLTPPKTPSSSNKSPGGEADDDGSGGDGCDHNSSFVLGLHVAIREQSEKDSPLLHDLLKELCSSAEHPVGSVVRTFVHYFNTMYGQLFDLIAPAIETTKFDAAVSDVQSFLVRLPTEFAFNYVQAPALDPQKLTIATHAAVFPPIAALLMPLFIDKFAAADQLFALKTSLSRKLPPDEMFAVIGIEGQVARCLLAEFQRLKSDPSLPSDLYPFLNAIDTLSDFGEYTTTHEKLCLLEATARHIEEYLKGFIGAFGADEFLPVFTFVLIQADIPNLHAHTGFIETFMDADLKCAMSGYLFTQLQVAIGFIMSDQFKIAV